MPGTPLLVLENINKSYGPVRALQDITLTVPYGSVVGLVGDNGAGKSTLVKIISGVLKPDSGRMLVNGEPVSFGSPITVRQAGIETVYQDPSHWRRIDRWLKTCLSVARNCARDSGGVWDSWIDEPWSP